MNLKFLIIFIVISFSIKAQNNITGNVLNAYSKSIPSARLLLKDNTNNIVAYTYTNQLGNYTLKTDKLGAFTLSASAIGFEQKIVEVRLENKTETKTYDFILSEKITEIKEIIIKQTNPIIVKKDTIVFDAKAFLTGNEQVVEDLLKKIPGLNIDNQGNIKVGDQEVEKVMIDGDDFFKKGYKILTKNMPVNPIDKVELLKNYSNNKHLKGIEDSKKVALNLTLKENAKRVWFGNANLGYGLFTENRYEAKGNLMNFGKKNKYYFLTNLNNIGTNATGDIDHLIRPFSIDEPADIGDNQSANTLLGLGFGTPDLKQKRVNLNNTEMLSLNSIFNLSNKIKLKTLSFLNTDEASFFRNSFNQFSIANTTFTNTEDFIGKKNQITGFGKIDLTYDISKTKTLEYNVKFNETNEKNTSNLVFNNNLLNEKLKANNQLFNQKIVYTNKFATNKVFLLSASHTIEKTPQTYFVNQFIFADLFSENANNTKQYSENKMQFAGIEAHLLNKKSNGDLLELKIGNQFRTDNLTTRFELLNNQNSLSLPNGYQNQINYTTNDLYLSAKYKFKINKFSLLTQSEVHQLINQLENVSIKTKQNPFYIVPKIGLDYKINNKNKIASSYSYNTTNAGILDVYSGFVQTGFRSFSKGLEEFNQLNAATAILSYNYGSWGDRFFANTFLMHQKNNDFYSTNAIISQNYTQSEKIIIKDREFLSAFTNIDQYFKPIKSNLKINLGASKTNFKNSVNGTILREVKSINGNYGFELRSGFNGIFNYHLGSKWEYNEIKTTTKNSFTNNMSFLDLSLVLNKKLNFQIQSERYFFGNLEKKSNAYYFLDLEARFAVKENKLAFYLSGNNLFNTKTFKNYNISDIDISKTEYRLMPRYLLLRMEMRF